ncbi:MAG: hypothetical protein Q9M89_04465 [Persephonella sp.]|nr:hypothetical protein [Persephonella sp.]
MLPALRRFKKKADYAEYGGAPLLGNDWNLYYHPRSADEKAIKMH